MLKCSYQYVIYQLWSDYCTVRAKARGPAKRYIDPKTKKLVVEPKRMRYKPKAFRLFQPVCLCRNTSILSKAGAMVRARVSLRGLRKCCKVQNPTVHSTEWQNWITCYIGLRHADFIEKLQYLSLPSFSHKMEELAARMPKAVPAKNAKNGFHWPAIKGLFPVFRTKAIHEIAIPAWQRLLVSRAFRNDWNSTSVVFLPMGQSIYWIVDVYFWELLDTPVP